MLYNIKNRDIFPTFAHQKIKLKMKIDFSPKIVSGLKNYSTKTLTQDVMAGIIVGIVAIPLAIAFGIASGVGPTEGLVTAIIAGLIISIFGGTKVQIGGPTGAFIVIIYGIIQQYGIGGLTIATIIAGFLLILMGLFKLGTIIKFVPYPIIVGFTGGIALTIFSTQINDLFGLGIQNIPSDFIGKWVCYFQNFNHIDWWTFGIGALSLIVIIVTPFLSKKIPGSLVAIIIATIVTYILKNSVGVESIKTIGDLYELPTGIPTPRLPELDITDGGRVFDMIQTLFPAAFTIAILGAIESLLSAMVADGVIGDKHNSNTELIAQGMANVITPFFGGIPATGAIARTMTNINNGGKTPIAGVIHAFVLLLVLLFLGKFVGLIPMPCLAGILIVVSYNMSGWRSFVSLSKSPKSDFSVLMVTFLLTVIFNLTIAIEFGLLLAVILFLRRTAETSSIREFHNEIDPRDSSDFKLQNNESLIIPEGVSVYEIDGPYFFGIANKFDELAMQITENPKVRIIRMRKVPFIDSTGIHNLETLCAQSKMNGIQIVLSGVNPHVYKTLTKARFVGRVLEEKNICSNINDALVRAQQYISEESKA